MNYRRVLGIIKFTLQRGYSWCQLPTMALIGAGILNPYFPKINLWQLALIAFSIFLIVGFIDKYLGILSAEQSYVTEMNTTLMKKLGEAKKSE